MPVNARAIPTQVIFDGDFDLVTPACINPWTGVLIVEDLGILDWKAVWCNGSLCSIGDIEMILLAVSGVYPRIGSTFKPGALCRWGRTFQSLL